jgi:hypothetical protein
LLEGLRKITKNLSADAEIRAENPIPDQRKMGQEICPLHQDEQYFPFLF